MTDDLSQAVCMECDAPIDLDDCGARFEGATPDGTPILTLVCRDCERRALAA